MTAPHGVLIVNKPAGPTSHDVVAQGRRALGTRAVGHAGTLDPMASGVLLLLCGEATKLSQFLTLDDKRYVARIAFGTSTDTLDAHGATTEKLALSDRWLDRERLESALALERQRTNQLPPKISAIRIGGRRAYELARAGRAVELEPRSVRANDIVLRELWDHGATVELWVSKGYYVRAFVRDLARTLGVPAHLSALTRVASGPFTLEEAIDWPPAGPIVPLAPAEAARRALPVARLTAQGAERAARGQRLSAGDFVERPEAQPAAWFTPHGQLIAIGTKRRSDFAVLRGFNFPPPPVGA